MVSKDSEGKAGPMRAPGPEGWALHRITLIIYSNHLKPSLITQEEKWRLGINSFFKAPSSGAEPLSMPTVAQGSNAQPHMSWRNGWTKSWRSLPLGHNAQRGNGKVWQVAGQQEPVSSLKKMEKMILTLQNWKIKWNGDAKCLAQSGALSMLALVIPQSYLESSPEWSFSLPSQFLSRFHSRGGRSGHHCLAWCHHRKSTSDLSLKLMEMNLSYLGADQSDFYTALEELAILRPKVTW